MPAQRTGARRAPTAPSAAAAPDATRLLADDHRQVHALFEDYRKLAESGASGEERRPLAEEICTLLTVHAAIEEEIFYPACEGKVDEDLLKESYVEHDAAKILIAQIAAGSEESDEFFDTKVKVLQEEIEHHVEEEEKRMEGLFAQARKAGLDMDALGEQLAARKQELTETYKATGLPAPDLTTMDEVSV
jgi:hemerythrin superfamily protein